MNPNIDKLYQIAKKPVKNIIGLMSGTSFDGLDVALCEFEHSGINTAVKVKHFVTKDYQPSFKEEVKSIFAKKNVDLEKVTLLNAFIGSYYAELILECLAEWNVNPAEVDLIASHGQTIFHAPKHLHPNDGYDNATLQIGDADHLAVKCGIITLSDFRQKHIAAGGEGAPLAVYGDYLIFSDQVENRIMLNVGGIANFTYLPANDPSGFFSSDVGPGNTLMDQFVQLKFPGLYYDKNAELARQGEINEPLLEALLADPFFKAAFPKTTGPEQFNLSYLFNAVEHSGQTQLSNHDILATLACFSAKAIIKAIEQSAQGKEIEIYISGGGMHNPLLVYYLEEHFGRKIKSTLQLGIEPDAKEAVLFALLANEAIAGSPDNLKDTVGFPKVSMGKISFPL
jgi:anhydro-N-acetylmuramic acid kinase